jgi:hypothetical protein
VIQITLELSHDILTSLIYPKMHLNITKVDPGL